MKKTTIIISTFLFILAASNIAAANDSVNISLSDLSKGIYHVHLSGLEAERKQSIRLVKN